MAQDENAGLLLSVDQRDGGPSKFQMCSAHLLLKPGPTRQFVRIGPHSFRGREEILFLTAPAPLASPRLSQVATPAAGAAGARYLTRQLSRYPAETQRLPTDYCNPPRAEYQSMVVATRFKSEFLPE